MAADKRQQRSGDDQSDDQETIPMDNQGASYSSSYNESTPGEVEANRQRALHEHEADDTAETDQVNQTKPKGTDTK